MEINYAKALEEHLGPAKDYPRLHRLIEEHLWATTSHAYEVSLCLERLNWNVKDLSHGRSSLHAPFEQPPSTKPETVINNIIVELTTEHYEIARYIELITAATNVMSATLSRFVCVRPFLRTKKPWRRSWLSSFRRSLRHTWSSSS
jgi:ferritin-like metal-binding protein YciE